MKKFSFNIYSIFTGGGTKRVCPVYFLTGTDGTTAQTVWELKKASNCKAYSRRDRRDRNGTSILCPGMGAKRRYRDRRDNTSLDVVPMFRPVAETFLNRKKPLDLSAPAMPLSAP